MELTLLTREVSFFFLFEHGLDKRASDFNNGLLLPSLHILSPCGARADACVALSGHHPLSGVFSVWNGENATMEVFGFDKTDAKYVVCFSFS